MSNVSKTIRQGISMIEYTRCRDGIDYVIPFPGLPGILRTKSDIQNKAGLFPHQLASLQAMIQLENPPNRNHFGVLRGGILGDAPGLGKTITMLALIANTAGRRPITPFEFWDQSCIEEGWNNMRTNIIAGDHIRKALKPIRQYYNGPAYQELAKYIDPPYVDDRFPTIRDFELYIYRKLRQFVPSSDIELVRSNLIELKAGLDKSKRKLLQSPYGKRLQQERALIPSSGTLIIVPDALLEHWYQQIHEHLHLPVFAEYDDTNDDGNNIRDIVYIDGVGDIVDATIPLRPSSTIRLPPKEMLSQYTIVIIPFSRCKEHFQMEVRAGRMSNKSAKISNTSRWSQRSDYVSDVNRSPFLQIRWLRSVTDEGHELGENEAENEVVQFIHELYW